MFILARFIDNDFGNSSTAHELLNNFQRFFFYLFIYVLLILFECVIGFRFNLKTNTFRACICVILNVFLQKSKYLYYNILIFIFLQIAFHFLIYFKRENTYPYTRIIYKSFRVIRVFRYFLITLFNL